MLILWKETMSKYTKKMRKCEDLSAMKKVNGECEKEEVEVAT